MNKRQRRQMQLERHYRALEKLAMKCGTTNPNGKVLSVRLLKLERIAHKAAEKYCNGEIGEIVLTATENTITEKIFFMFGSIPSGFFINNDPRGYALKIKSEIMQTDYAGIGLQKDWGGYGLLAPEIDGN